MIQAICEILSTVAALAIAGIAWRALNTWQREFVGKRNVELAEEILALFYEARDNIMVIRYPSMSAEEAVVRQACAGERTEDTMILNAAYTTLERYQEKGEFFCRLFAARCRFIARFGDEKARAFTTMKRVLQEITSSAQMLLVCCKDGVSGGDEYSKLRQKYSRAIWYQGEGDHIVRDVDKAIADMEAICRASVNFACKKT